MNPKIKDQIKQELAELLSKYRISEFNLMANIISKGEELVINVSNTTSDSTTIVSNISKATHNTLVRIYSAENN